MQGIEIDLVIEDSVRAFGLYETVFGAEKVEVTAYRRGLNEAIFTLHGTRFHLLDNWKQSWLKSGENRRNR